MIENPLQYPLGCSNEMKTFERNNNCDIMRIQFQIPDDLAIFLDAFSLNCVVEVWLEERHVASVM